MAGRGAQRSWPRALCSLCSLLLSMLPLSFLCSPDFLPQSMPHARPLTLLASKHNVE